MNERDNMNLTPEEQRLQESVRGLGEVRADEDFRARLRAQFVSGEIVTAENAPAEPASAAADSGPRIVEMPAQPRRRRFRPVFAVPAIAAMLWIVIFSGGQESWRLEAVRGEGMVRVDDASAPAGNPDAVAALIQPAARITVPEGVEIDVVLDDVMVLGVAGPASFTLPDDVQDEPFQYTVAVHDGEFRFKSGPGFSGREAFMLTTEGKVEITGTTIAVFKNPDVTCVCILEGTAMVGKDDAHMDPVPAGMRKVMFADGSTPKIISIEPGHAAGLADFEGHNEHTFDQ